MHFCQIQHISTFCEYLSKLSKEYLNAL